MMLTEVLMRLNYFNKYYTALFITLFLISTGIATEVHADSGYKKIIENKVIKIGISNHYPPLNFNKGKKGLEIEMSKMLGKFLNVKVKLVPMKVHEYTSALKNKNVDIVIAGFSRSLERAKNIWFSKPYLNISPAILVKKSFLPKTNFGDEFETAQISTLWDLKGRGRFIFGVKKGSSYEKLLKKHFPKMKRVIVKSNEHGLSLLKKGKIHGFIHDSLYLKYIYQKSAKISRLNKLLHGGSRVEKICIGIPFGEVILKNQLDLFISELIRQGVINDLLGKFNKE